MELTENKPWVTFCMTTYKRPEFLKNQLTSLLKQTFQNFEVVISDNDPEASGKQVVEAFNEQRFRYYSNGKNIGMIASFNKSIEKAITPYIVMLTDDDHVDESMLNELSSVVEKHPGCPIYMGCRRFDKKPNEIEIFDKEDYAFEFLHPKRTLVILWSSCLLDRRTVQEFGGIPDFGSPHFADHALLLLCGKNKGGVFINKLYGSLASHDQNFSKSHFDLYYNGCVGFHNFVTSNFEQKFFKKGNINALEQHLHLWFLNNYFALKKYFTYKNYQEEILNEINSFAQKILSLSFMKSALLKFRLRQLFFLFKTPFFFIKYRRLS